MPHSTAHSAWPHAHFSNEAQTLCLHRLPCPCLQVVSQHLLLLLLLQAQSQWEARELPEPSQEPCERAKQGVNWGCRGPSQPRRLFSAPQEKVPSHNSIPAPFTASALLPPGPIPELGLCTMRYSGAPRWPLRSSTHVAVRSTRGCFFAALQGKLVTPKLLSHSSAAGRHNRQSPVPVNINATVKAQPKCKCRAATATNPGAHHSPQHQAPGWSFQTASERQRPDPSPPVWDNSMSNPISTYSDSPGLAQVRMQDSVFSQVLLDASEEVWGTFCHPYRDS